MTGPEAICLIAMELVDTGLVADVVVAMCLLDTGLVADVVVAMCLVVATYVMAAISTGAPIGGTHMNWLASIVAVLVRAARYLAFLLL
jgi:hypothetical protein